MMRVLGRTRTASAAVLVVLALLLQLLVPLPVARAEATPICTAGGIILLAADDGAPAADHADGDHCQLCLLPRVDATPATAAAFPFRAVAALTAAQPPPDRAAARPARFTPYAQRAPPAA